MRLRFAKAIALGLCLCLTACHKKVIATPTPSPLPPPPPSYILALEDADNAFASGDFARADSGYDEYIRQSPDGDHRDRAIFRRGVIHNVRGFRDYNPEVAASFLKQVVAEFPMSPLKPVAQLILSLQDENGQIAAKAEQANHNIQALTGQIAQAVVDKGQSEQKIRELSAEREQLLKQVQELVPMQEVSRQFAAGNCTKIVPELEGNLRQSQASKDRDVIQFVLAVCYALPEYKANSWELANKYFNQIDAASPLKPIARLLQAQHFDLETVRQIDSQRARRQP